MDPIAELSAAADMLAERGMDEAARVLMDRMSILQQMHAMNDMADRATFIEYQSAYNQMRRQIMESLNIPKSLLKPNPETTK